MDGRELLIVPHQMVKRVIYEHHDAPSAGHPGKDETIRQIQRTFYWRRMYKQVGRYVNNCLICHTIKARQPQDAAPMRANLPDSPFHTVSLDLLGPYPKTRRGNRYVLVAEDLYSKWVEAKPVPDASVKHLITFFEDNIVARYGVPVQCISDNGKCFISQAFRRLLEEQGVQQKLTGIEHQRANPVERRIQELKKVLRVLLRDKQENQWEAQLPKTLRILRGRTNAATGYTPSKIILGYELPLPGEWNLPQYQEQRRYITRPEPDQVHARQLRFVQPYHKPDEPPPVIFQVGDMVMLKQTASFHTPFSAPWSGPHPVTRRVSDVLYEIERDGFSVVFHIDKLRPAPRGNDLNGPLTDEEEDDDDPQPYPSPPLTPAENEQREQRGRRDQDIRPGPSAPHADLTQTSQDRSVTVTSQGDRIPQPLYRIVHKAPPTLTRRKGRPVPKQVISQPGPSDPRTVPMAIVTQGREESEASQGDSAPKLLFRIPLTTSTAQQRTDVRHAEPRGQSSPSLNQTQKVPLSSGEPSTSNDVQRPMRCLSDGDHRPAEEPDPGPAGPAVPLAPPRRRRRARIVRVESPQRHQPGH